jgi:hypothetical protein
MYGPLRIGDNFGPKFDLDLTLPELFLRVEAKLHAEFRKDGLSTDQDNANFSRINPAVVREALTGEIINGSDRLNAGETTTCHHEGEHPLAPTRVGLDTGGFQHRNHPGPQHHRIAKRLDAKRMFGHAWNSEIVRFRAKRQNEVIKRQLSGKHPDSVGDRHSPSRKVDRFDFPTQNGYMPKQLAKRIADVRGIEISSCHLVKHRRKESEVIPAYEGDLDIGAFCRGPVKVSRGLHASESAAQNNDLCFSSFPVDFVHHVQVPQVSKYCLLPFSKSGRLWFCCS